MKATAQSLVRRYVDAKGVTRYTGVKRKLKNSQLGPDNTCGTQLCECCLCLVKVHASIMCALCCRKYTRAFGYRIGALLPNMCSHITGLRAPQELSAAIWLSMLMLGSQVSLLGSDICCCPRSQQLDRPASFWPSCSKTSSSGKKPRCLR